VLIAKPPAKKKKPPMMKRALVITEVNSDEEEVKDSFPAPAFAASKKPPSLLQTQRLPPSVPSAPKRARLQLDIQSSSGEDRSRPSPPKRTNKPITFQPEPREAVTEREVRHEFANENVLSKSNLRKPKKFDFSLSDDDEEDTKKTEEDAGDLKKDEKREEEETLQSIKQEDT